MGKFEWLLYLHVTGAFLFLGGIVFATVLNVAARRRDRPSEVAALMKLLSKVGAVFGLGFLLLIVFGLWLVHVAGHSFADAWVIAALVLFGVGNALGGIGGSREKGTLELAERLAAEGDQPSPELRARLRDPVAIATNYATVLAGFAVLALMIWKPGAGG